MASSRSQAVADVLWELKQAEKLGTLSRVARRAGFSPGSAGKTILNVLEGVRREWPHLQWWRVVRDDGTLVSDEQSRHLKDAGIKVTDDKKGRLFVLVEESVIMIWAEDEEPAAAKKAVKSS
jgi:alkylated DNA nucleotide flippase Atl1